MTCTFSAYQILKKRKSWTSSQVGSRQVSSGPLLSQIQTYVTVPLWWGRKSQASRQVGSRQALGRSLTTLDLDLPMRWVGSLGQVGWQALQLGIKWSLTILDFDLQYLCGWVGSLGQVGRQALGRHQAGPLLPQIQTYLCGGQVGRYHIVPCNIRFRLTSVVVQEVLGRQAGIMLSLTILDLDLPLWWSRKSWASRQVGSLGRYQVVSYYLRF